MKSSWLDIYKSLGHRFRKRRLWHTFVKPWLLKQTFHKSGRQSDGKKRLLLVKTDLIGDYLLFRNLLPYYREKYADYHLILCANSANKTLVQALDREWIDDCIFLNRNKFLKHKDYYYQFMHDIYSRHINTVLHPTFTPDIYADMLVFASLAAEKIGVQRNTINQTPQQAKVTETFYTQLVATDSEPKFEFYRNKEIAQTILNMSIPAAQPSLKLTKTEPYLKQPYAVVAPGASHKNKRWGFFDQLVFFLKKNHHLVSVLVGAGNDKQAIHSVIKSVDSNPINLYNQTSLIQLLHIIAGARLVVSNDTAPVHMGAILGVPTVGISSGTHAFRFNGYPPEFVHVRFVFPPTLQEKMGTREFQNVSAEYSTHPDINSITTQRVKQAVDEVLSHNA